MTNAEYFTERFYAWEYRGRGWHLCDGPIELEPPYIPYVRIPPKQQYIDDGKRHTWVSKAIEYFKDSKEPHQDDTVELDYETLLPFAFEEEPALIALQVKTPRERKITPERVKALLTMLSYADAPISFEIIGTAQEIVVQFVCHVRHAPLVHSNVTAYFPELTIAENDTYLYNIFNPDIPIYLTDFGLQEEFIRPLAVSKNYAIDPLTSMFGALDALKDDEQAGVQMLFMGTANSWPESIVNSVTLADGTSFFSDAPESPKLAFEKIASPLFGVCIRTFGQGSTVEKSQRVFESVTYPMLAASRSSSNSLISLPDEIYDASMRISDMLLRQSHRLGMLLNADELANLLHFPSEAVYSHKLYSSTRKTKEVPSIAKYKPYPIGINVHNGITEKVSLCIDERLKHTHIIGSTGTGKSTLIANMISTDIKQGLGLVLIDPHGDLVDDVIARIPEERLPDVVLIDPSDSEYPVAINILEAHNDIERELLSSDLVASFRKLSTSWGDQMNAVFSNAVLAMLESDSRPTLHDLRRFLIEREYRMDFLKNVKDASVRYYWKKEFPLLKTSSIGPILTRLNAFLRPRVIRNMLGQKEGLNFEKLINSNKIILVKLPLGLIGTENSYLLGSMILSKIHQAAFARQSKLVRNPFFIYIDEFQNVITPSIKEMLSGVRKYNIGLILSHQDLQQLQGDTDLLNSVLGAYTRIVFRVGEADARKLKDGFSSFDVADLQNLGRGEALIRIEQPKFDCSLDTLPLQSVSDDEKKKRTRQVIKKSRQRYAWGREDLEKYLAGMFSFEAAFEDQIEPEKNVPKKPIERTPAKETSKAKPMPEEQAVQTERVSTHRYLQTLVKKMAEARGYTATIENQTPSGTGTVDVLLAKDAKTIAVEICITTDPQWEMHNISKCVDAGYDVVVSLSGDIKQLEKIKKKCGTGIPDFESKAIHFFTPDALFHFLDVENAKEVPTETVIKGYRVNVSYDTLSQEEMKQKRTSVAQVVLNSLRKKR